MESCSCVYIQHTPVYVLQVSTPLVAYHTRGEPQRACYLYTAWTAAGSRACDLLIR